MPFIRNTLKSGSSLAVQWLGLQAFNAEGLCSNPGQGVKTPGAVEKKKRLNKEKKDKNCFY